jgi:flagellar biosynthesis/type III secretory pathway chaperone
MVTPPESLSELVAQLGDALAEERQALLSGKPEQIAAASQKKAALADRIEAATAVPGAPRPSADSLTTLARYNQENGVICDAMLRHLTDAIDRVRQIDLHRSYNADGTEQNRSAQHALGAA